MRGAVKTGQFADGYNYDVRVLPRRNVMLTSSFTGAPSPTCCGCS